MLKLKRQYFSHLIQRADSLEKTLMLRKTEGGRRRQWQRMRWLNIITTQGHESEQTLGDGNGQGSLVCCGPWGHKESDTTKQLNNNNWEVYTVYLDLIMWYSVTGDHVLPLLLHEVCKSVMLWSSDPQSVVPGPAVAAASENILESNSPALYQTSELEIPGCGPASVF